MLKSINYNMQYTFPRKLKSGDTIEVIAPAHSLGIISHDIREIANKRFADMGLKLSFGKHVEEQDEVLSSSIESRIRDLHDAFLNPDVSAIIAVIGGFNSNQLLRYIDWDIIRAHPKILCGYSDINALSNAMLAKTGLVSYSGPAYSSFGQKLHFEYTLDYFKKCLFSDESFSVEPTEFWTDDQWYLDQDKRSPIKNDDPTVIHEGEAEGTIVAGNLCTFQLLHGTEYMPSLAGTLLFLEDDEETRDVIFDRDLQSLIHQPGFEGVRGIVIARFEPKSNMSPETIKRIINTKRELDHLPVIANADFGHTMPIFTFPIGGTARISARNQKTSIEIVTH